MNPSHTGTILLKDKSAGHSIVLKIGSGPQYHIASYSQISLCVGYTQELECRWMPWHRR